MRKKMLHTIFALALLINANAQTIAFQGFELGGDTWPIVSGAANISNSVGGGNETPAGARIRTGAYSWQVNNADATLQLDAVSVSGYSGVKAIVRLTSTSNNMTNGADGNDTIQLSVNVDGGGFPLIPDITLKGKKAAKWTYGASLAAVTNAGTPIALVAPQGGESTNNYATIEINIPDGSTSVALEIRAMNNANAERWNIDDIELVASTNVFFDPIAGNANENGATYNLNVSIFGASPVNATSANIVLTSGNAADIGNYTTQTVNFPAGSGANQVIAITLTDDADIEVDKVFTFEVQNVMGGNSATAGTNKVFTLTVIDNEIPNIVINEIFARPTDLSGDANGDGIIDVNMREDEFVEIVNKSAVPVDISGWTISDITKIRHVFPNPTILGVDQGIVIFGGGTPTGIPSLSDVASTGQLNLNNNEEVVLARGSGTIIDSHTFLAAQGADNVSLARSPDFTGFLVQHTAIPSNPVAFSPGQRNVDAVALPIELTSFEAEKKENRVLLSWTTATELNNDYMVVERSDNGRNFEEIGRVAGAGTTTEQQHYQFWDKNPLMGVNYYRLRQVDLDGRMQYHRVVNVAFVADKLPVRIAPSLVREEMEVDWQSPLEVDGQLQVVNMLGQMVHNQLLETGTRSIVLQLGALHSGHYFLRIEGGTILETMQFIKE